MLAYQIVDLSKGIPPEITALIDAVFPEYERTLDLMELDHVAKDKGSVGLDVREYFDGAEFVGISVCIPFTQCYYVLYYAVRPELQSKGYGGRIIEATRDSVPVDLLFGAIESLTPGQEVDNMEQRRRRWAFYERNGYVKTDYQVKRGDLVEFDIIGTKSEITPDGLEYLHRITDDYRKDDPSYQLVRVSNS